MKSVTRFDTAVVGGGVIGCSIAWRLAEGGQRVALLERDEPGQQASWAAGGMLAPLAEADQADAFLALCLASRTLYPSFAQALQVASGIDIEYRTEGTIYLALSEADEEELERRWQWQQAAGLHIKKLNAACVRKLEPAVTDKLRWALKFPDDHQVNSRRLMLALQQAARRAGVTFFTQAEVRQFSYADNTNRVLGVWTPQGELRATNTVLATGAWTNQLVCARKEAINQVSVAPVRGQMLAFELPQPPLAHVIYSCRGYVVPRAEGILIAGSTTEHVGFDKRNTASGIASILAHATEIAPVLAQQPVREIWTGLRPKNMLDSWPILGHDAHAAGLLYATGHYRNGILLTPITAQVISELILHGEASFPLAPFSPLRFG